ncbi:Protein of unknown function [Marivirga sericea]|uniref:DUF4197 domain-containing protein n=1 Tax=Marivirga sericea TaxID=1028 RepID=A0A1X7KGF5_9BACT|nr:DUF4197 domain-containing protein [Marivirga sericea]SMG40106.1 Protein of unknown function [Marivirga sericea]
MKKLSLILSTIFCILLFNACEVLQQVAKDYDLDSSQSGKLTEREVIKGLKSALEVGTKAGVDQLATTNGFLKDEAVKIFLPAELESAILQLKSTTAGKKIYDELIKSIEADMIVSLNRAAEKAVVKAKPIFVNAISSMTVQDGFTILKGSDNAATNYLRNNTFNQLVTAFKPDIKDVLDDPIVYDKSSEQLYSIFVKTYNEVERKDLINVLKLSPIKEKDLASFVTERALDGMFQKVALKEKDIRENPAARINDILKKVFAQQ